MCEDVRCIHSLLCRCSSRVLPLVATADIRRIRILAGDGGDAAPAAFIAKSSRTTTLYDREDERGHVKRHWSFW